MWRAVLRWAAAVSCAAAAAVAYWRLFALVGTAVARRHPPSPELGIPSEQEVNVICFWLMTEPIAVVAGGVAGWWLSGRVRGARTPNQALQRTGGA